MNLRFCMLLLCLLCVATPAHAAELTVAVASNVKYAFVELAKDFTRQSGIVVKPVVASSGKITAQAINGAPYDVFMSADTEYPELLAKEGHAATPPKIYAYGTLVLWTLREIDLKRGLPVLGLATIKKIAVANPRVAPYGREALKVLDYYGLQKQAAPKLVYGESVAQVNQYIDSGSADIGFTAKSIVVAPETAGRGRWMEVPAESYQPIAQAAVILKHGASANAAAARSFMDYLDSSSARTILAHYGYKLP